MQFSLKLSEAATLKPFGETYLCILGCAVDVPNPGKLLQRLVVVECSKSSQATYAGLKRSCKKLSAAERV